MYNVNHRTQKLPTTTMLTYIGWLSHEITYLHQEQNKKVTREQLEAGRGKRRATLF